MELYPRARLHGMRWILIEASDRVLPEIDAKLADYAVRELRGRGIDIRLGTTLDSVDRRPRQALDRRTGVHAHGGLDRRRRAAPEPSQPLRAARRARPGADRRPPPGRRHERRLGARRLRRRPGPQARDGAADRPARAPPGQGRGRQRRGGARDRRGAPLHLLEPDRLRQPRPLQGGGTGEPLHLLRLHRLVDGPHLPPEPDPGQGAEAARRDRLDGQPLLRARRLRGRLDRPPAAAARTRRTPPAAATGRSARTRGLRCPIC